MPVPVNVFCVYICVRVNADFAPYIDEPATMVRDRVWKEAIRPCVSFRDCLVVVIVIVVVKKPSQLHYANIRSSLCMSIKSACQDIIKKNLRTAVAI